jgi:alpha-glucosidase
MPPARALFLNDPGDPEIYRHIDNQFFVGKDFLVAPILFPAQAGAGGVAMRSIYLPAGDDWYAFKDNSARLDPPVKGGTTITEYRAGLDHVPIFIRSGAILPMHSLVEQYVGELAENPLEINFYPGPDDVYLLYQDDGITTRAEKDGACRTTEIGHTTAPGRRTVRFSRIVDAYTPPERFHLVRLLETSLPSRVTVAGNVVPDAGSLGGLLAAEGDAYWFDEQTRGTVVKVFDNRAEVILEVAF